MSQHERTLYISQSWWTRWKWLSNPGPIRNSCRCIHGAIRPVGAYDDDDDNTLGVVRPITQAAYSYLHKIYGGDEPVKELRCSQCLVC